MMKNNIYKLLNFKNTKKNVLVRALELCVEEDALVHQNGLVLGGRPLGDVRQRGVQKRVNFSQTEVSAQTQRACRPILNYI